MVLHRGAIVRASHPLREGRVICFITRRCSWLRGVLPRITLRPRPASAAHGGRTTTFCFHLWRCETRTVAAPALPVPPIFALVVHVVILGVVGRVGWGCSAGGRARHDAARPLPVNSIHEPETGVAVRGAGAADRLLSRAPRLPSATCQAATGTASVYTRGIACRGNFWTESPAQDATGSTIL